MLMSNSCLFDQLPVELLHTLFNYFSASELLFTFRNVNDYVNTTLVSYPDYHFNLKFISKVHFHYLCCYVRPEQVISLTLSDGDDTPGQSEAFFSCFRIEQFTRLRSLTLIEIEFNSLECVFANLHKLDQLRALSFDNQSIRYQYSPQDRPVPYDLRNVNMRVWSRLNRLHLNNGTMLTYISFPHLRHLKLEQCSDDELETIFQHALQLKSLSVCLNVRGSNFELIIPPNQLTRLSLEIKNYRISMSEMEQLLSQLPSLKYLELKAKAKNDIANGYQWQVLATSLIKFNFRFNVSSLLAVGGTLKSFCTPFWLKEKRWFVAYQDQSLFSIPYFTPPDIDITRPLRIRLTAPNSTFLYNHVNKIIIKAAEIKNNYYFTHVQTLEFEFGCTISLRKIQLALDLNRVEHLIVSSVDNLLLFMPLKCTMPQLYKLTFKKCNIAYGIEQIRPHPFEQILELRLRDFGTFTDGIVKELFRLFPFVQRLEVEHYTLAERTMICLIDGFKYLSNASFLGITSFVDRESSLYQNADGIIEHSQRLTHNNLTCRIYRTSDDRVSYHWWIDEHSSTHSQEKYR